MHHCIIHIDGGARGNPGPAGAGVVIVDADDGTPLHEAGYFLGRATNNVAEYQGLLRGLELAAAIGARKLMLYSDSQLLVRQLMGEYRVKSADLRPLYERVQSMLQRFEQWTIEHVRREHNTRADALANRAMDAKADIIEADARAFATTKDTASRNNPTDDSPSSRWSVTLITPGAHCPANQPVNRAFTFGPTTPAGCCIHVAAAALKADPLHWPAHQREGEARCAHCRACLALKRI